MTFIYQIQGAWYMTARQWKKTLIIGAVIALTSQLYWDVFLDYFRISTSVILLPVLLMTVGMELHTLTTCFVTSAIIFAVRFLIQMWYGNMAGETVLLLLPNALFYISYGIIFKLALGNRRIATLKKVVTAIFLADLGANIIEAEVQEFLQFGRLNADIIKYLAAIAFIRTVIAGLILLGEQQYRALLKRTEHEQRYQRLFLMTTGLKNEIYFMRKNSEEIESVMANAYRLYEKLSEQGLPEEMKQMSLAIARDVHEIKKDYFRIIQGIEQEIGDEYDEEKMSFHDLLQILEASTYHAIGDKRLNIRLIFDCRDNFITREHYALMAVLKNLVNNAIEAIESGSRSGEVKILERKSGDRYLFEVADDGPGISARHLPNIFQMGYSTKFDYKTGNIYRGVGLWGVKNTVEEQFKGTIEVVSNPGQGTRFLVGIPAEILEES